LEEVANVDYYRVGHGSGGDKVARLVLHFEAADEVLEEEGDGAVTIESEGKGSGRSVEVLRVVGRAKNELGVRAGAVAAVLDELAGYWRVVEPVGEVFSKCWKIQ
jgi:hypothetical protein